MDDFYTAVRPKALNMLVHNTEFRSFAFKEMVRKGDFSRSFCFKIHVMCMYRDAVLDPKRLHYFAVTDGFAPVFGGVWGGKFEAIYAYSGRGTNFDGVTDGHIPYYRVDGKDVNGEPVLVVLSTSGPEHDMIRTLFSKRRILDQGPEGNSHRNMTYREVVEKCTLNTEAPVFEKPELK